MVKKHSKKMDTISLDIKSRNTLKEEDEKKNVCLHPNIEKDVGGLFFCKDCFGEIHISDEYNEGWGTKYTPLAEGNFLADASRCSYRKNNNNSINKFFNDHRNTIPASESQIEEIKSRYKNIVGNVTNRGARRTCIIAACYYHVLYDEGMYRTTKHVCAIFGLQSRILNLGMDSYYEKYKSARNIEVTPKNILSWVMFQTNVDQSHYGVISTILDRIYNKTTLIRRSAPQTIAAAVIYYFISKDLSQHPNVVKTKTKFAGKVQLSEITLISLVNEIDSILS